MSTNALNKLCKVLLEHGLSSISSRFVHNLPHRGVSARLDFRTFSSRRLVSNTPLLRLVGQVADTKYFMASSAVAELRRIRTAEIDDPERVVALGGNLVKKGGQSSAGDECIISFCCKAVNSQTGPFSIKSL